MKKGKKKTCPVRERKMAAVPLGGRPCVYYARGPRFDPQYTERKWGQNRRGREGEMRRGGREKGDRF